MGELKWNGWLNLPRQVDHPKIWERRIAKAYARIDGEKIALAGNNALRLLELSQPLRRCPGRFVAPKSTLESLRSARIAETDFPILKCIFDKISTGETPSPQEIGQAREILRNMGLSMTLKPELNLYEIRSEGDEATVERSASETRKLSFINLLREPISEISLRVSDFAAERFQETAPLMPEEENKNLIKSILLLQRGMDIEENITAINRILAPYNFKLKSSGPKTYELTTSATLTILSGPSGAGKGTAVKPLLEEGLLNLTFFTCRAKRGPTVDKPEGELYGSDYYFVREEEYVDLLLRPDFFVARAGVHGKYQGVHRKVFGVVLAGQSLYAEMDIHLARQIIECYEATGIDIRNIFLVPPEYREHLGRLIGRHVGQADLSHEALDYADIERRAHNGVNEIKTSITLPPSAIFIVNEVIEQTAANLRAAMDLSPPIALLSSTPNEAVEISGKVSIKKYRDLADSRELQPVDQSMLVLNLYPAAMDRFKSSVIFRLTSPSRTTQDTLVRIVNEALHEIQETVWNSRKFKLNDGKPMVPDPVPTMGIHVGTLSPFHYGHMTASYAGLIHASLNSVVLLPGGETTDKPFALAAIHREKMVTMALEKNPWLLRSPLRIEMADCFGDISTATLGAADATERKLAIDLIALNWLIAMNPHVNWGYYLVGVDKVNDYGQAKGEFTIRGRKYHLRGKNEHQLLEETLVTNNIGVIYHERGGSEKIIEEVEPADSWLMPLIGRMKQEGKELFTKSGLPALDITGPDLRRLLKEYDPRIKDALDPRIIDYIYRPATNVSEEYTDASGKKKRIVISILQAFVLEASAINLGRRLKANALNEDQLEEAKRELAEINMQKKILAHQGILASDRSLTFDDLKKLDS